MKSNRKLIINTIIIFIMLVLLGIKSSSAFLDGLIAALFALNVHMRYKNKSTEELTSTELVTKILCYVVIFVLFAFAFLY